MKRIKISGVGCALADYLYIGVDFTSPEFEKYYSKKLGDGGLSPGRLVFAEEFEAFAGVPFKEILNDLIDGKKPDAFNIGGPSIVALIHVSQLLYNKDTDVFFYGAHGDDAIGKHLKKEISKFNIDLTNYIKTGKKTPFTYVFSDQNFHDGKGERIFVNNIGAAWKFLPNCLNDSFYDSDIVVFGGTALVPKLHDNLTALLNKAKSRNCVTVVNTVFDFRNEKKYPNAKWPMGENDKSFKLIDVLIMDFEEALRVSGESDINLATEFFLKKGVSSFIITYGANPIRIFSDGNVFKKTTLKSFPISEAVIEEIENNPKKAGDTTGCGDNFVGGVLSSLATQMQYNEPGDLDIIEALSWGVASGGFACFYTGGTFHEKYEGEKFVEVAKYYQLYKEQIEELR